jgi:hypothetical protein
MRHLSILAILALAAGCDYEAPLVPPQDFVNGGDKPLTNVITGEIVLGVGGAEPSTVVIFVADAANRMPPYGTGSPRAVATIPGSAFTTNTSGLRSASFSVSGIPDPTTANGLSGKWVVTAFMDMDDNFNPLSLTPNVSGAMAGATCGDIAGAHVADLVTGEFGEIEVSGGKVVEDVIVTLGATFSVERPAFSINGFGETGVEYDNLIDSVAGAADPTTQMFQVASTGIHSEIYDIVGPDQLGVDPCATFFPLYGADADGDGVMDPHPTYGSEGLYEVWPRAFLSYLGEPQADGTFVNDLEVGHRWAAEAVPNPAYPIFGQARPGEVVPRTEMEFMWLPGARHFSPENLAGEVVTDVAQLPKGAWSVTLISFTGQTWNVPNDTWRFDPTDPSFDPASQLEWLVVE